MKSIFPIIAFSLLASTLPARSQDSVATPPAAGWTANDPQCQRANLICGIEKPEDLVSIPGTPWVLTSSAGNRGGGIFAIDTRNHSHRKLYPSDEVAVAIDKAKYATCPGDLTSDQRASDFTVGLALKANADTSFTVYATHLGWDRGIDVLRLQTKGNMPSLTLVGCVIVPKRIGADAIIPVGDDGFLITNWLNYEEGGKWPTEEVLKMKGGMVNGEVWSWAPGKGWAVVQGSQMSGPNGIEMDPATRQLYVAEWGSGHFVRMESSGPHPRIDKIPMPFRPDNVRWARDGSLLVVGQAFDGGSSTVVQIDPKNLAMLSSFEIPNTDRFKGGTGALEVGDDLWIGSIGSNAIMVRRPPHAAPR